MIANVSGIKDVHESVRAKVDSRSVECEVVCIHHAMTEAMNHKFRVHQQPAKSVHTTGDEPTHPYACHPAIMSAVLFETSLTTLSAILRSAPSPIESFTSSNPNTCLPVYEESLRRVSHSCRNQGSSKDCRPSKAIIGELIITKQESRIESTYTDPQPTSRNPRHNRCVFDPFSQNVNRR